MMNCDGFQRNGAFYPNCSDVAAVVEGLRVSRGDSLLPRPVYNGLSGSRFIKLPGFPQAYNIYRTVFYCDFFVSGSRLVWCKNIGATSHIL